jgi:LETM1-like protein
LPWRNFSKSKWFPFCITDTAFVAILFLKQFFVTFTRRTLEELAKEQKRKATKRKKELEEAGIDLKEEGDTTIVEQSDSAGSMLEFLKKARNGERIPPDVIIRYATYFKDDLTLDNMPRMQLINMCKYMGIQPYGSDSFLRFQLRHKIRVLKEDDQRILWEGIETLTKQELREACQERGMRSTGLSKEAYRRSLQEWLNLSVNRDLPIALLIMSRSFFLQDEMFESQPTNEEKSLAGLADAISGMDKEILNEVILEVATTEEKRSDPDVRKIKLEVLSQQNELIREEEEAREADAKKKASEKAKVEKVAVEESLVAPTVAPLDLNASAAVPEVAASPTSPTQEHEKVAREEVEEEEESKRLSTEEMDVISQLISDDPVSKERQELARIKAAMKEGEVSQSEAVAASAKAPESVVPSAPVDSSKAAPPEAMTSEEADRVVKQSIEKIEAAAALEAEASTQVVLDAHVDAATTPVSPAAVPEAKEVAEDPIISRLKKRVESMVDKIEVQLSETQIKIGDKLHFLDKDRDGILSREEMASALQQVLKRQISLEEAMEIAEEMVSGKV